MLDKKQVEIEKLNKKISQCQSCQLYESAINHVPGFGNINPKIVFVGEAPGAKEDKLGLPFVGNSGKLLDKLLLSINLSRSDVFICNTLKHRPPENRDPLPHELQACAPFLKAQLKIIEPKVIVTLGRYAMNYFLPDEIISQVHGKIINTTWQKLSLVLIPVYHPSAGLRNGGMLKSLQTDFQIIGNYLKTI